MWAGPKSSGGDLKITSSFFRSYGHCLQFGELNSFLGGGVGWLSCA